MTVTHRRSIVLVIAAFALGPSLRTQAADSPSADDVLKGLRVFFAKTARADGSFQNGIDPDYRGMSDSAYSDLAAITYAVTLHKTFGWKLPFEARTAAFLVSRQKPAGEFFNVAGTVKPESAEGKTYNTTQALVALRALGVKPQYDPLPVFDDILKEDYKELPAYTTSFFPLAYLCAGKPIPDKADRGVRALMIQDRTGYMNDHIAATFHASHYYHLVGEPTPKSPAMVARILSDQKADGSWSLNMPSRDRHGTFDAVFTLHHEGHGRADCQAAIQRAARWALSCRNDDGGFGHYPGSTSDADANYFQIGTLVMAGFLKPVDPLPADPHLLSWGHLVPVRKNKSAREVLAVHLDGWVGTVAFSNDSKMVVAGSADNSARVWDIASGRERLQVKADGYVSAVSVSPTADLLATASYGHTAAIWNLRTGEKQHDLKAHRGAVLAVAFHPDGKTLATSGIDGGVILWDVASGNRIKTLLGHKSWVNALAFSSEGQHLFSGSSDGTVHVWDPHPAEEKPLRVLDATNAEVRSIAASRDGRWLAAGIRYGQITVWDRNTWREHLSFKGHESDVWAVAFTPDSATLVSGNGDWNRPGHVKLWDMKSGQQADSFQHTGEVLSLAVSPDGRYLAAGGGDKALRVWELKTPGKSDGSAATTSAAELAKLITRDRNGAAPSAPQFPFDAAAAKKYQHDYATWLGVPTSIRNHVGQEFVLVPPGQFLMGSPVDEPGHATTAYDETQHPVRLTQPFYLARHETTVGQFRAFVERTQYVTDGERNGGGHAHDELAVWQHRPGTHWRGPGYAGPFSLADHHPVVHVSHTDAVEYCRWLNENGVDSARYALPTEAEWEWACRAGTATRFWWGQDVDGSGKVANVGDANLREVHPKWPREIMPMNDGHAFPAPVGSYRANAFGLHDMLGNVWEFCSTRFGKYPTELTTNPGDLAPDRGFAVRGGGWSNTPHDARSATRNADPPHFCHSNLGFRVAIKLDLTKN